jgi:membrane protein implicated in regulation of membrane protease activity
VSHWQIWLVLALLLFVAEMFAPGFWLISVGLGALVAAAVGLVLPNLIVEVLSFAGGALASLLGVRPLLVRRFHHGSPAIRTNVDALIGKTGYVSARIEAGSRPGRVIVEGENWRGVSVDDAPLEPGTKVTVLQVDGTTLLVEREEQG